MFAIGVFGANGCKGTGGQDTVAKVGDRLITVRQYSDALKRLMPPGEQGTQEDISELKKELINQLIEEELMIAEAGRAGITVDVRELSQEVEGLKKEYGDETFKEAVEERYGSIDNWKEEIRRKLLIKKTVDQLIGRKAGQSVTEKDAREYYIEHIEDYDVQEQAHARMIVAASEDEAGKIRKRLNAGNFAAVAEEVSLSPERKNGGDLGYFARGDMPKEFEDAVFKLKTGEISPVVKTEYGYHIFLLEGRRSGRRLGFEEVKARIMERLRSEKEDSEVYAWIKLLKKKTKITVREDLL
ncbi:MAG: peptidyl-prolyl cis-trans isomerase [Deltaproteobacteria bacterium]|nr:peptidyl-prolyl cis-trans isomerase [Deltaproteobacteria bacterium]